MWFSTRPSGRSTSRAIMRRSTTSTISSSNVEPATASSSIRRPRTETSRETVKRAPATACPSAPSIGTAMVMRVAWRAVVSAATGKRSMPAWS